MLVVTDIEVSGYRMHPVRGKSRMIYQAVLKLSDGTVVKTTRISANTARALECAMNRKLAKVASGGTDG